MSELHQSSALGTPGTITVVAPPAEEELVRKSRKRSREDAALPPAVDLETPPAQRDFEGQAPTYYVDESEDDAGVDGDAKPKSDVHRLLEAKHRRRRMGRHVGNDQIQEDLDDVKKFLSLSPEDREAYLSIYEYDGSSDNLVEGLAKVSTLALRVGLAASVHPRDYDLASIALDMPEVKDSLATIWDCVDITSYADVRAVRAASAIGHIGDTLLGAAMKLYQGVARASELRYRREQMERRKSQGIQSVFDLTGGNEANVSNEKGAFTGDIPTNIDPSSSTHDTSVPVAII